MTFLLNPYRYNSSFSPSNLSNGLMWLDASDASTITDSGGSVSQWDDKFGNGNNATQGTGSLQPITGTRTLNGLNVIDFAGNDRFNLNHDLFDLPSTIFIVAKSDSSTLSLQTLLSRRDGSTSSGTFLIRYNVNSNSEISLFTKTGTGSAVSSINPTITIPLLITTKCSIPGELHIEAGGVSNTTLVPSDTYDNDNSGGSYIGSTLSSQYLNGYIAEIIIYGRLLDASETTKVQNYLNTKWGL